MKLKKGDHVVVASGKDKGKTGTIARVLPQEGKVLIDGVNVAKRHQRGARGQSGTIIEKSRPVDASNVMLMDPKEKKGTRVGRSVEEGKTVRVTKKSGTKLS